MKVLHITTAPKGGAGIAAYRLHQALQSQGVASAFLSKQRSIDFEGKPIDDSFFAYKPLSPFRKIINRLFPSAYHRHQMRLQRQLNDQRCEGSTLALAPYSTERHPWVQEADIIHLHWVGGIINFPTFFAAINTPIVWTLHDMNPFMGLFHYEGDEARNRGFVPKLDALQRAIKKAAYNEVQKGAIVCPSRWMLDKAKKSKMFHTFPLKRTIPNAIDLNTFRPIPITDARKQLELKTTDRVALYITDSGLSERKGIDLLQAALEQVQTSFTLLTVGRTPVPVSNARVVVVSLGFVNEEERIIAAYNSANVVLLPSKEDNLPNVMLEAFACGVPVLSYANGGMAEHINNQKNGMIVSDMTASALAKAIDQFFSASDIRDGDSIRTYAEQHFSEASQASAYNDLYQLLQTKHK